MAHVSFSTRVLSGFPVCVSASISAADPDVGIFNRYVEEFTLTTVKGKPARFIEVRLSAADIEAIEDEALSEYRDQRAGW